jgi:diguanylate cyclase (GGDEF)-like protein
MDASPAMSAPPDRHHAAPRVLVVADDAALVPAGLPSTRARTLFDALGLICRAPRPFDWVILRDAGGNGAIDARRGADALRRLAPSARIGLVLPDGVVPGPGTADPFDAVFHLPADASRLYELLDPGTRTEAAAAQAGAAPAPGARDQAPPQAPPAAVASEAVAPTPASEPVGDVDLVEALLGGRDLAPLALAAVAQQTHWSGLRLAAPPEPGAMEPGAAAVPVRHDGAILGWLSCPSASAAELEPWAAWLASWLGLERRQRELRAMAYRDDLTGVYNRRYCGEFLCGVLDQARALRRQVTVMVFDIDNFKQFNDRFGHAAGDRVLIETVRLLSSVIRRGDRVCRIGGDEFAVIFADLEAPRERGSSHPTTPEAIAGRFQRKIADVQFRALGPDAPGPLTISAGLATFPWDAATPEELLVLADRRALSSKRAGKNAITIGKESPGAD